MFFCDCNSIHIRIMNYLWHISSGKGVVLGISMCLTTNSTEKCTRDEGRVGENWEREGWGVASSNPDGNNGEQTSQLEKRAGNYEACQIRGRLKFTRQYVLCSLFVWAQQLPSKLSPGSCLGSFKTQLLPRSSQRDLSLCRCDRAQKHKQRFHRQRHPCRRNQHWVPLT